MKVLFITLEQSGRQILKSLLDENFFNIHKNQIFTFGMNNNYNDFKDITNIKVNSIMGFVNIILNIYLITAVLNLIMKNMILIIQ